MKLSRSRRHAYALVFTLGVVALLAALGAMLTGPSSTETQRVDLHYRKVQAEYLSLAGLERASWWASQGVVTNELYLLANGTVDTVMERIDDKQCRVVSIGRLRAEWRQKLIDARTERILELP